MKRICFPATNRVHLARQQLLLDELRKYFQVDVFEPETKDGGMAVSAILYAIEFNNYLIGKKYDAILVRGDRYEMLGIAVVSAYCGIPIIHLEGGDLSGVIDNKVRHAITHLSDVHFCTNQESFVRLIHMGLPVDKVYNYGSLDVEFASKVEPKRLREKSYIMVAYHPIYGENFEEVNEGLKSFPEYDIVGVKSNKDYGVSYGNESFSPEDYINMMRFASCCVGNSSSLLKEASILQVPVVNVGSRQDKRLKPRNVLDVACDRDGVNLGINFQMKRKFDIDYTYYQKDTSKKIAEKLKEIL